MTHTELKNLPPTISVEEAGRILGLSRPSSYQAANDFLETGSGIPVLRFGRRLRVSSARLALMLGIGAPVEEETEGERTVTPLHRTQP